jgi:hypothetical protein
MKAKFILAAVLVLGVSAAARAQTIGERGRNERERITEGRRDGALSKGEAFRLNQEQKHIGNEMYRDRRFHGRLTPSEKRHIRREQRIESRKIYRMKHHHGVRYY